ncbi:MAG: DUF4339 domain-containing protein [Verrucomicrobiota bacterium]
MTWFFNNDGAADGPHDEPTMLDFIQSGRLTSRTLIWHDGMPAWKEAGMLQAVWWQPVEEPIAKARLKAPVKSAAEDGTPSRRIGTPMAPIAEAPKAKVGLLKRLFGRK